MTRSPPTRRLVALGVLVAAAGCGAGNGVLHVSLSSTDSFASISTIAAFVAPAHGQLQVIDFPISNALSGMIATDLTLTFPPERAGDEWVYLDAYDNGGLPVASTGAQTTSVPASAVTELAATLATLTTFDCNEILQCYAAHQCNSGDVACMSQCEGTPRSPTSVASAQAATSCYVNAASPGGGCADSCQGKSSATCANCLAGTCSGAPPGEVCTAGPCVDTIAACDNDI